ncbi:hypothetical protein [uncultured Tateyamaria sp.]|uniref:hypothetical protein n=1 Tax=uncultured Tateyamaria sp. TaxID=455651 RepID=UPI002621C65F|nr:hypothetical protein [uncultured Tateyamaria sp.]
MIEHLQNDREPTQNALAGVVFIMAISVLVVYPLVYLASWWQVVGAIDGLPQDLVDFIRNETLVSLLQSLLMFGLCAGTALLSREASLEYGRWQRWPLNHIPFLHFFIHALFPGLAAVLLCSLAKLEEQA